MAEPTPAVFVVIHRLGRGGLTTAVLDQVRMFRRSGHRTVILTLDAATEQPRRERELRDGGWLDEDVVVVNLHAELRARWAEARPGASLPVPGLDDDPALLREEGEDHRSPFTRYYDRSGTYVAFRRRRGEGRPGQVDYFSERRLLARELVGIDGRVYATVEMVDGEPCAEHWLAADGESYVERSVSPRSGKGRGVVVRTPRDGDVEAVTYGGMPDWHTTWLQGFVDAEPVPPIVLAESPSSIPKVARLRPGSATRLGMMHNNQYDEAPFRPGSPLRPDHAGAFAAIRDLDALVVLSEPQRLDLVAELGHADRIRVVPNATVIPELDGAVKDPLLVSVVTRLDPLKNIDEAIHAFPAVLARVPGARFEIYGSGADHARLAGVIAELGLAGSVELMGRTTEPHAVMARSTVTVLTSSREAMPLAILESHAAGTAIVTYDYLYGPATLVEEGRTGLVVPWGDRDALADALVELLEAPERAWAMGAEGRLRTEANHRYDVVERLWEDLFAELGAAPSS